MHWGLTDEDPRESIENRRLRWEVSPRTPLACAICTGTCGEWCLDDWHDNYDGAPTDGSAWLGRDNSQARKGLQSTNKVLRGRLWVLRFRMAAVLPPAASTIPTRVFDSFGFRVLCAAP